MPEKGRILVAMSGGLDSSVSALLLQKKGYEIVGATFRTWDYITESCNAKNNGCCSIEAIHEASAFSAENGFEHHILDFRQDFRKIVIDDFVNEYRAGRTPNPCVTCNAKIKWGLLLEKAKELGCAQIATGHYACIGNNSDRYFLKKAVDKDKDQTYFLWQLTSEQLSKTIFPLGSYRKKQIREMASDLGFSKLSSKRESQEICFIPQNDYAEFIEREYPTVMNSIGEGDLLDTHGNIIGRHKGFIHYTIGQRKGLGFAAGYPLYVKQTDALKNTVTLAKREELFSNELFASGLNFTKYEDFEHFENITTCIRYNDKGTKSSIIKKEGNVHVIFEEPVLAITPGQSVAFYEGKNLIGGGIIK
ncbi:MAG: tRNA 2-thiouridine(34) synthase MnmA [Bacteroidales bacterium]|jgi:tRNA-specific 2-thiouridylase|nr:tRNA 2-thiouridine(34) synthase MnmA [Bacteroidales bacterium]MDD4215065.1 tRNA 2-thiouridine(34) synthase MnmA [Bacteroidales bacterium]